MKKCNLSVLTAVVIAMISMLSTTGGYNILGVFTSPSPSHLIIHMSLVKALAEKGHNVTVITGLKPTVTHPNIKVITIMPPEEKYKKFQEFTTELGKKEMSFYAMMITFFSGGLRLMTEIQYEILKSAQFKQFLNTPDTHFDLMVMGFFMNDYQLGVAAKFKCPVALDWSGPPMDLVNEYIGNPYEVAYVPNMNLGLPAGTKLGFLQRLKNLLAWAFGQLIGLYANSQAEANYNEYFAHESEFPTLDEMRKNVSLLFVNNHFSEGPIRPNVPAFIEIGGIQVKDKPDPLPKDIADFLDNSKTQGAILFSLGSNLKGSTLEPEKLKAIYKTIASLKQNVIWKWDDMDNLPGKSKNILYKSWLPQDDILAHPNLKLFITHAGKGGVTESQYHGVPMLAIPFFADQASNAANIVGSGKGLSLKVSELTEQSFRATLKELLENPKYTENVKRFSRLYRDRPLSAKESVVYWSEYVIRHKGAAHMQSPLVHMNFIQSSLLDVTTFLLLVLWSVFATVKFVFKLIKKLIFKPKSKKLKQK